MTMGMWIFAWPPCAMLPLFASISDEVLIVIAIPLVGGLIVALTSIVTSHYRKLQRDDMTATLKMEMIQRGMSADEIERVLAARMADHCEESSAGFRHRRRAHEARY